MKHSNSNRDKMMINNINSVYDKLSNYKYNCSVR